MSTTSEAVRPAAATVIPDHVPLPESRTEPRVQTSGIRVGDLLAVLGAAIGAISLTALLGGEILPVHGFLANFLIAYVLFLALYAVLVGFDEQGPVVRDRVIAVMVQSGAFLLILALSSVLIYTAIRGAGAVVHLNMFTQDMSATGPSDPLSKGGIIQGIVGTLIEITIALLITIPLGITAALYLNEVPGRLSRFVRTIVEAMTALPSIVAGLFVLATLILALGFDKSGFAAGVAITVMMLPIMIRAADVVFRLVPATLKEASLGLGASQFKTVMNVILPTSKSGLTTAVILATARGIGETSPVLLTSGFAQSLNTNPFKGPMVSLPLDVFQFKQSPEPLMIERGFGTAIVLMVLVLILFLAARRLGAQDITTRAKRLQRRAALLGALRRSAGRVRFITPQKTPGSSDA